MSSRPLSSRPKSAMTGSWSSRPSSRQQESESDSKGSIREIGTVLDEEGHEETQALKVAAQDAPEAHQDEIVDTHDFADDDTEASDKAHGDEEEQPVQDMPEDSHHEAPLTHPNPVRPKKGVQWIDQDPQPDPQPPSDPFEPLTGISLKTRVRATPRVAGVPDAAINLAQFISLECPEPIVVTNREPTPPHVHSRSGSLDILEAHTVKRTTDNLFASMDKASRDPIGHMRKLQAIETRERAACSSEKQYVECLRFQLERAHTLLQDALYCIRDRTEQSTGWRRLVSQLREIEPVAAPHPKYLARALSPITTQKITVYEPKSRPKGSNRPVYKPPQASS